MRFLRKGRGFFKRCSNCGYETAEDFDYCPKCGLRF
ncbi:zinc-ribbon domain-containing protein [Pseudobutyrivibrio xylanivorans]